MKRFVQTLVGIAIVGTSFLQPLFVVGGFVATNTQIAHAQFSTWSSTKQYTKYDTVLHNASNWIANTNNKGKEPGASLNWDLDLQNYDNFGNPVGATTPTQSTGGGAAGAVTNAATNAGNQSPANTSNTTTPPPGGAAIPGANPSNVESNAQAEGANIATVFKCVFPDVKTGTFTGCMIQALYNIIFIPLQFIAFIAAQFLDFFISYSINSESYRQTDFVERGWSIVRDLTNILFIFSLLYIAFNFILNKESNAKKLLINVILVGLAINFSLFITRVIIDAGNVLANVFYNQINVVQPQTGEAPVVSDFNEKQISAAVVSQSNPQKIITNMEHDSSNVGATVMVILAASLFAFGLILLFGRMAFLFLGRTVGLMIQMIFAPLAFASNLFPNMPLEQFKMKNWFMETLKLSFLAPIFLFFLYLVVLFLDASKKVAYPATNGTLGIIINVLLPYALTWAILQKGTKITNSMAGEAATMVTSILNKAGGFVTTAALGVATGGTAAIGRATLGRAGASLAAKTAGKTNAFARGLNTLGNKAASSNFDFRATAAARFAQQKTGVTIGNQLTAEAGGWRGMQNRFIAEQQRRANEFAAIGPNEKKFDKAIRDRESELEALRNRRGKTNAAGVDIDQEYVDKTKELEKLQKALESADTDKDKKTIKEKIKQQKEAIRRTDKYAEIHAAREKVSQAKKAKKEEEERRREKFANNLVSLGNPLFIASNTRDEAIRKIRGDVDDTKDNFGKPTNNAGSGGTQPASTPTGNTTTTTTPNNNPGQRRRPTRRGRNQGNPYNTTNQPNNVTPQQPPSGGYGSPASGTNTPQNPRPTGTPQNGNSGGNSGVNNPINQPGGASNYNTTGNQPQNQPPAGPSAGAGAPQNGTRGAQNQSNTRTTPPANPPQNPRPAPPTNPQP